MTNLLSISLDEIYPFLEFGVDGLLPYALLCVWLLPLSRMLLRIIHVVTPSAILFFIAKLYSVVWLCQLVHLFS